MSACVRRARAVVLILAVALAPSVQANQSSDGIWTDVAAGDAGRGSQTLDFVYTSGPEPKTMLLIGVRLAELLAHTLFSA